MEIDTSASGHTPSHRVAPAVLEAPSADDALARAAASQRLLRFRRALTIGVFLWPAFAVADYLTAMSFNPAMVGWMLLIRLGGTAVIGAVYAFLRLGRPGDQTVKRLETFMLALCGGSVAAMGAMCGGVESPYPFGIVVVMLARYTTQDDHWKDSILPLSLPVLSYPLAIGVAALLGTEVRAQLSTLRGVTQFNNNLSNLFGALVLLVAGGQAVWALRRQVYAARNLGRYRLTRKLGAGGMGEVWAARHHALRREVALKILKPDAADGSSSVVRFEREVRATSELSHPNTIRVFDYGSTEDGLWYYAMELLEGEDLGALIRRTGALPAARAVHLLAQAARALAEAHGRGLVHRDLKPANLFLTTVGGEVDFVKVLDFGIVRFTDPAVEEITHQGTVPGTPRYMAPEAMSGARPDARADVYSLGAVLHFLLTGRHAFEQTSSMELLVAKRELAPPAASTVAGALPIPPDLDALVLRCLSIDPLARPADAGQLSILLQGCSLWGQWTQEQARAALAAAPPSPSPPPSEEGRAEPLRRITSAEPTMTVAPASLKPPA